MLHRLEFTVLINKIFKSIKYLEKGLDASWMRNQVISNNIANVDTPDFKASKVKFESVFASALANKGFIAKRTREKHISFDRDIDGVSPVIIKDTGTAMRMDGNNVDIDSENVELARNTIYYNTLIEKLNSKFTRLKMAINEGK